MLGCFGDEHWWVSGNKRPTFVLCPVFTQLGLNIAPLLPATANLYFNPIHFSPNFQYFTMLTAMLDTLKIFGISAFFLSIFCIGFTVHECHSTNLVYVICEIFMMSLHFPTSNKTPINFLVVLFCVCNKQPILFLLFLKLGASGKIWALAASFAQNSQLTRGISHLQHQHHLMLKLLKLNSIVCTVIEHLTRSLRGQMTFEIWFNISLNLREMNIRKHFV